MATTIKAKEVFLSYGREPEVSAFVKQLKQDLETRGISVWLDIDDIPAGSDWHGAIGRPIIIIAGLCIAHTLLFTVVCTLTFL